VEVQVITPVCCLFNIATCGGFLFLTQGAEREEIPRVAAPTGYKTSAVIMRGTKAVSQPIN
ncbi:hypothetical protein ACYKEA_004984, partial [Pluralibacter gergoviae]